MKRFAAIMLAVLLMLCLAACRDNTPADPTEPETTESETTRGSSTEILTEEEREEYHD